MAQRRDYLRRDIKDYDGGIKRGLICRYTNAQPKIKKVKP